MQKIAPILLVMTIFLFSSFCFSEDANDATTKLLEFQIVQDQYLFDNDKVKSASIIEHDGIFDGLVIELKPQAVTDLARMTGARVGKRMNLILNKQIVASAIIQSPLGDKILIKGITREEAQEFINTLKTNAQKTKPFESH